MDRISDSGSDDLGSNPGGITKNNLYPCNLTDCRDFFIQFLSYDEFKLTPDRQIKLHQRFSMNNIRLRI